MKTLVASLGLLLLAQPAPLVFAKSPPATPAEQNGFVNSLGMKFVPAPGTAVLFSIWDTRVKDYKFFVNATGRFWKKPSFKQGPTHPAVNVSWEDAKAFCQWLTKKERGNGLLKAGQEYRLPTDAEWSVAVGLTGETGGTPQDKDGKIKDVYPWGTEWPPPRGAGNYGPSLNVDDFVFTSPVGSFAANRFGLYDMGGNVWQWCGDFCNSRSGARVLRGGSWFLGGRVHLLSSVRSGNDPAYHDDGNGFRCVLTGSELEP